MRGRGFRCFILSLRAKIRAWVGGKYRLCAKGMLSEGSGAAAQERDVKVQPLKERFR